MFYSAHLSVSVTRDGPTSQVRQRLNVVDKWYCVNGVAAGSSVFEAVDNVEVNLFAMWLAAVAGGCVESATLRRGSCSRNCKNVVETY